MTWCAIAPVAGAIGLGGVLAGYDGAMQPVRSERAFLKACTNHLRSSGEPLTPDGTKRAYDQCTLVHVTPPITPEAIGSGGASSPFGPGRAAVDSGGWGKGDPETGGWGAR